jgi:hypothetical protein
MKNRALAAALALLVGGCDLTGGREEYPLTSVNRTPLPAPVPSPYLMQGSFVATSGKLTLHPAGELELTLTVACPQDLPPGSECSVEGSGRISYTGTYSRAEEWAVVGERRYPATFDGNAVEVTFQLPTYLGFFPVYRARFQR